MPARPAVSRPALPVLNLDESSGRHRETFLAQLRAAASGPPAGRERLSIPFFFNPHLDAVLAPAPLPAALAARARGISDDPVNPLLAGYGANALKGWLRAHPRVAERHYPDLLAAT